MSLFGHALTHHTYQLKECHNLMGLCLMKIFKTLGKSLELSCDISSSLRNVKKITTAQNPTTTSWVESQLQTIWLRCVCYFSGTLYSVAGETQRKILRSVFMFFNWSPSVQSKRCARPTKRAKNNTACRSHRHL